jgi:hypothetical protein
MAKKSKRQAKRARKAAQPRDLAANNAKAVKGGRKAGSDQQEYVVMKFTDLLVSN